MDTKVSEKKLFFKIKKFSKKIGAPLIYKVLLLYYTLLEESTPRWAKVTIVSALAYFIMPVDVIADMAPLFGYSDDMSIVISVIALVDQFINDRIKARAREAYFRVFNEYPEIKEN